LHLFVDNETQLIIGARTTHGFVHDQGPFPELFDEVRTRFQLLESIYADAGYYNHQFYTIVGGHGIQPHIDLPNDAKENGEPHHDRELARRRAHQQSGDDRKNPRSNVESVNSQLKRMTYRNLRSQRVVQREVELISMCIVYNLMRIVLLHGTTNKFPIPFADDEALLSLQRDNV
jgi:hypothetical protein